MSKKKKRRTSSAVATASLLAPGLATGAGPAELEAHVIARPDDLDARRVLGDALLERGDPRGEYLRLALQLAELAPWEPGYRAVERAVRTLEARYGRQWSRAVAEVEGLGAGAAQPPFSFCRGAVEQLRGRPADVARVWQDARGVAPICALQLHDVERTELGARRELADVRRLDLTFEAFADPQPCLQELLASPHLERIEALRISGMLSEEVAELLADSPALRQLRELELAGGGESGVGAGGLRRLADAGVLGGLRRLSLGNQRLGDGGWAIIAGLEGLQALAVSQEKIGKRAIRALAGAAALASLRALELEEVKLGEAGAAALVAAPALGQLRTLDLSGVGLNGKKLAAVLDAWALPEVTTLRLAGDNLREDGARALAATRALTGVVELDLAGNGLKDAGAAALAEAEHLPRLERLRLDANGIDAGGMAALAAGPLLRSVTELQLRNNKCQNAGGLALARWPALPAARALALFYNWMGVKGVRAIIERLEAVEELHFGENNYGVEPARALASSTAISGLRTLSLRDADETWLRRLAESPAGQRLETLHLEGGGIDAAAAGALTALPSLGRLHLSFTTPGEDARPLLDERFGPFLTCWPPRRG